MYFPYFYSGQYEAETIFKLKSEIDKNKILPIVDIFNTQPGFMENITRVINSQTKIILVINSIEKNPNPNQKKKNGELINSLMNIPNNKIIPGIYIDENIEYFKEVVNRYNGKSLVILHGHKIKDTKEILETIYDREVLYHVFRDNALQKRYLKKFDDFENKVILEDPFIKRTPNSTYEDKNLRDEKFYDLHIRYKDEGFCGMGDFLTIGSSPTESQGKSPKTIVIHYTYPEDEHKEYIWIKRFIGKKETSFSTQSTAILDAMKNLEVFLDSEISHFCSFCPACTDLKKNIDNETSYNLGELKKFSMLHHAHMISKLINI